MSRNFHKGYAVFLSIFFINLNSIMSERERHQESFTCSNLDGMEPLTSETLYSESEPFWIQLVSNGKNYCFDPKYIMSLQMFIAPTQRTLSSFAMQVFNKKSNQRIGSFNISEKLINATAMRYQCERETHASVVFMEESKISPYKAWVDFKFPHGHFLEDIEIRATVIDRHTRDGLYFKIKKTVIPCFCLKRKPCRHRAHCQDISYRYGVPDYKCFCGPYHCGKRCHIPNECQYNPFCKGTCKDNFGSHINECGVDDNHQCICNETQCGRNCEIANDCAPENNRCGPNGDCVDGKYGSDLLTCKKDRYFCKCHKGYCGKHCDQKNDCLYNSCSGVGQCIDDWGSDISNCNDGNYTCICIPGWTGAKCQTNICDTTEHGCDSETTNCVQDHVDHKCECKNTQLAEKDGNCKCKCKNANAKPPKYNANTCEPNGCTKLNGVWLSDQEAKEISLGDMTVEQSFNFCCNACLLDLECFAFTVWKTVFFNKCILYNCNFNGDNQVKKCNQTKSENDISGYFA